MSESESKSEKPNEERRFDPNLLKKGLRCDLDQYEFLIQCSQKGEEGIKEWNKRRRDNPNEEILLEGAKLWEAKLQGANLRETCLQGAELMRAYLQGAEFGGAKMQGADFSRAIVDGETLIWRCEFDRKTMFESVALGNMRIYPKEKQLLECNIRRKNWEEWYRWKDWYVWKPEKERSKSHQFFLKNTIGWFWLMSDYGRSTGRIVFTFLGLAIVFAIVYRLCPSCVMVNKVVGDIRGLWHALYFSVVTMTTLGFGDIAANPDSWGGQTLLMVQVILGYVLLGALITRFAVLFTAGGPAGKFANGKEKKDERD